MHKHYPDVMPNPGQELLKIWRPCSKASSDSISSAPNEPRHPMVIPTWTASFESGMSPAVQLSPAKKNVLWAKGLAWAWCREEQYT